MSLKKILMISFCNAALAGLILSVFLLPINVRLLIQGVIIFFAIIFLGLLVLKVAFERYKNNLIRYLLTLLLAFSSSVISLALFFLTDTTRPDTQVVNLEAIGGSLMLSLTINIFIFFWAWILAGTIVYYIYYCHYNDTRWMED